MGEITIRQLHLLLGRLRPRGTLSVRGQESSITFEDIGSAVTAASMSEDMHSGPN